MKKFLCITLLLSASLLIQCKKKSEILVNPDPGTEVPNSVKPDDFLKAFTVTGAEKIVFDSAGNNYYVSLPDSYNESRAEVKLSIQKNIFLWDSTATSITKDSVIKYSYKGTSPLRFKLSDEKERSWFNFTVYFNFSGTPNIELLSKEIPMNVNGSNLPLRYLARVGSIPSSPEQWGPIVKVTNRKTGYTSESNLYTDGFYVNFNEAEKLLTDDPITLEIKLYNQKPVVFEGIKFTRGTPTMSVAMDYKYLYAPNDTVKINGGFFVPTAKYSATFTSDYIPDPVKVGIKFTDVSRLTVDKIPASLPEGSYVVSFYENDKLLGKNVLYLAPSETNSIESIWKGDIYLATSRNVIPLSFNNGDEFFAKTSPVTYSNGMGNLTADKLAIMRLTDGQKTVELKPELVVFNWAIAGVSYAVGKYKIPSNLASGTYNVTALSANGIETKPYWSKLQIR